MKKVFFTLSATLIAVVSFSQITVTTNDMPVNGHVYTYSNAVNDGTVDVTNTGANMTWDFSQLAVTGQTFDTIVGISSMPIAYQIYFFGSDQSIHAGGSINLGVITISDIWNVYDKNTGDYSFSGYGGLVSGFPAPFVYSPKDRLFSLPVNYGNLDSSSSNFSVDIPTVASINQQRVRVNEVDGWGTVITPLGSSDCLRVKSTMHDHDSITVAAIPFPIPPFDITSYEYKWIALNGGEPIVQVNAQDVFGSPQVSSIKFQDTLISNSVQDIVYDQFKIHPTIADQYFFLVGNSSFISNPDISIYNIEGKLIQHITKANGTAISIDTHNWENGMYIITFELNGQVQHSKVMVQHM